MMKVGVTGGIGSGKSQVCKIFEFLGIPIYYADEKAKELYFNEIVREKIIDLLGRKAYLSDTEINKEWISRKVFSSKELLNALNSIIHPAVAKDYESWLQSKKGNEYVIKEAAIMIESGSHTSLDKLILVLAPEDIRVARVKKRDGSSDEHIRSRIRKQMSDHEKLPYADFLIRNDGSKGLIQQVLNIHNQLLND